MKTLFEKSDKGEQVNIGAEFRRLTNDVICKMAMSLTYLGGDQMEPEDVQKIIGEATTVAGKFNLADYIGFCKNLDLQGFNKTIEDLHRRFDKMMEEILKEKEKKRKLETETTQEIFRPKDVLDQLLDITNDGNSETKPTRDNIKAFVMNIFVGGTDTTGLTVDWALAELINHPTVLQRAREETNTVVDSNKLVKESDIPNLPYLQAIVKETLRLHPVVPLIPRQSTEDCTINGYHIPARTTLFVNLWATGRDPNCWPEPLEFRPERFVENDGVGVDVRGQHFQLLPFGTGRRICPGMALALQVVYPTLAAMIPCFDWKVDGGRGKADMTEAPGLTMGRPRPLICRPVARVSQMPI